MKICSNQPSKNYFIMLIVGLAVYNVFYGAVCYFYLGVPGVILGMNMMLIAGIIGVCLKNKISLEVK